MHGTIRKSKEFTANLKKKITDLHNSGMSLFKHVQIPRSFIQATVSKYRLLGGMFTLPRYLAEKSLPLAEGKLD